MAGGNSCNSIDPRKSMKEKFCKASTLEEMAKNTALARKKFMDECKQIAVETIVEFAGDCARKSACDYPSGGWKTVWTYDAGTYDDVEVAAVSQAFYGDTPMRYNLDEVATMAQKELVDIGLSFVKVVFRAEGGRQFIDITGLEMSLCKLAEAARTQ
eukprot:gene1038-990_t